MIYRNKLGTFTFDDLVQPAHMKLIVQNVTGQYLNPKKGEPRLDDEASCYLFIQERCGNVLSGIEFELEINENVRISKEMSKIEAFEHRMALALQSSEDMVEDYIKAAKTELKNWFVGPAAVR